MQTSQNNKQVIDPEILFLKRLKDDGQRVYMDEKTASEFDVFSKGEIYKNKQMFEQAAFEDILECKQTGDINSVVKSEMIALREEHKTKTQMPIND